MTPKDYAEMRNLFREQLAEANTCIPAHITDYDAVTRMATVRPAINKRAADGRVIAAPEIYNVQVKFPSAKSNGVIISFPINVGDGGLLHFSQRSIEQWLEGNHTPEETRTFDLNDAFFVPGVEPWDDLVPAEPDCLLIKIGASALRMYPDGSGVLTLPAGYTVDSPQTTFTGNVQVDGTINSDGDTTAAGISVSEHDHLEQGDGQPVSKPR